ncbi:MAG: glycosyltransferase family 39 protein, partial [Chloroflexales bacterium]
MLATCCLGLYLLTLTQVHTFDALSYILDVDRKPWPELFHPHHLAYGPLGALIRAVALLLGWRGSTAMLIQMTNALAGAVGVTIFAGVVRRATGRVDLSVVGALLLGSSYAFWYYAVEVEVYTIACLFLILALALLSDLLHRPSPALAAALGITQGFAVLFHQTNVLLSVPVAVAFLVGSGVGGRGSGVGGRSASG